MFGKKKLKDPPPGFVRRTKPKKSRPVLKKKKKEYDKPVKAIEMIIEMREQCGLNRHELARSSGNDPKYLWNLERGIKRNPSRWALITLTRALVAYTKLFDETDVDAVLKAAGYPPAPLPKPESVMVDTRSSYYRR
jgi:hypothetical protein